RRERPRRVNIRMRTAASNRARENDAGGAAGFDHLAARRKLAGFLIDPEGDDAVALQVGRVEQVAGRIEGEKARRVTLRRLPGKRREPAVARIDTEGHHAIVPAV